MSDLIVSLDTVTDFEAMDIVDELGADVQYYKIGSVLFTKYHTDIIHMLKLRDKKVLLDLKLFDVAFNIEETCKFIAKFTNVFAITVCHYNDIIEYSKRGLGGGIKVFTTPAMKCTHDGNVMTSGEFINECASADGILVDNSLISQYITTTMPLINVGITKLDQLNVNCDYNIVGKLINNAPDKNKQAKAVLDILKGN